MCLWKLFKQCGQIYKLTALFRVMEVDFLLIGQGIAGTALAFELSQRGKSVLIIDDQKHHSSSRVAAGLYNPITGRKMVKTWYCDALFPLIEPFYEGLEEATSAKFLFKKRIYRPFLSIEEQNEWMGKSATDLFADYVLEIFTTPQYDQKVNDPYGGILLNHSGYLAVAQMLDAFREAQLPYISHRREQFDESKLILTDEGLTYTDVQARFIVYCNGLAASESKYFNFLPFHPVKGEILTTQIALDSEQIINRGVFMVPTEARTYRVGSTYSFKDIYGGISAEGKDEILEKLATLIHISPKEILAHVAGVRPATKDRRPFVGVHPSFTQVAIVNGLGAKGVSLAPYCVKQLLGQILDGHKIDPQLNITRYL